MTEKPSSLFDGFPEKDSDWSEDQWESLLEQLVAAKFASWREICSLVLGHLNPSQVGTSIASKQPFQKRFPKRKTWEAVRQWHFDQPGVCNDCGTRLELQADHIVPKEIVGKIGKEISEKGIDDHSELIEVVADRFTEELKSNGYENISDDLQQAIKDALVDAILAGEFEQRVFAEIADRLSNMLLRCRRCNVIRRPSHKQGGKTFLTTEAALMWILLVKKPRTYKEFAKQCRSYGMTMANIRFEEAWAMAMWLERDGEYDIDTSSKFKPS